jgi:hypothetical protein
MHIQSVPPSMVDAIEKIFTNKIRDEYEQKYNITIQINTNSKNDSDKKDDFFIKINGSKNKVDIFKKIILKKITDNFLENFCSFSIPSSCLKDVGPSYIHSLIKDFDDIIVHIDRELVCMRIFGSEKMVHYIKHILDLKLSSFSIHHNFLSVEEYMLPTIMGSKGIYVYICILVYIYEYSD